MTISARTPSGRQIVAPLALAPSSLKTHKEFEVVITDALTPTPVFRAFAQNRDQMTCTQALREGESRGFHSPRVD